MLRKGGDVTIITYGIQIHDVLHAADTLAERNIGAEVIKLDFLAPLDMRTITVSAEKTGRVLVFEETAGGTGVGARIIAGLNPGSLKWAKVMDLGRGFVQHGDVGSLRKERGLDEDGLVSAVMEELSRER